MDKVFVVYVATAAVFWLLGSHSCHIQLSHHFRLPNLQTISPCDRIYVSPAVDRALGTANGTFKGPDLPHPKSSAAAAAAAGLFPSHGATEATGATTIAPEVAEDVPENNNQTYQCLYLFVGGLDERVKLSFNKMNLRSESPECLEEYTDIYSEVRELDTDLLSTPFGGRFCDQYIPRDRVSLYRTIVLSFHTEKSQVIGERAFKGTYEFINAASYVAGTALPHKVCSYEIFSEVKREGEFMSPTYPGIYPKNIRCTFLFKGIKGQRVKLEFLDFDLYSGGPHCPLDYLKIYDGENETAPLVNTYCGSQRQLMVYSSGTSLFFEFVAIDRVAENRNRGFSGFFEFSEKFVNLGFILNNENSEHIAGTECDQKVMSKGQSNGTIYAPNYPFLYHPNTICKYFFYGLHDSEHLERINLQFDMLKIPSKDENECSDAYIRLYTQSQAPDEFDYAFCGETIPQAILIDGPSLLVVFNSGNLQGQGFKANYWFENDYRIAGTQATPGMCSFKYASTTLKYGDFNSPRHPSHYPSNTFCTFEFFGEEHEQIMLVFNHFKLADLAVANDSVTGYNERCQQDWLEIYSGSTVYNTEKFLGRYCSSTAPGPFLTDRGFNKIRILMNTDESEVSSGFAANYGFINSSELLNDCGGNFVNSEAGIITTPGYPGYTAVQHLCDWMITVRPGHQILLSFEVFSLEGDQASRGCSGAVVRVWTDLNDRSVELCGSSVDNDTRLFLSKSNKLQLTFTSAKKSVSSDGFMADGFLAIWTEVYKPSEDVSAEPSTPPPPSLYPGHNQSAIVYNPCLGVDASASAAQNAKNYFYCSVNNFCIARRLRCNDVNNCGTGDNSDETGCIKEIKVNLIELVGGLAGISLFGIFSFGIVFLTAFLIISSYSRTLNEIKQGNLSKDVGGGGGGMHYRDSRGGRLQVGGGEYSPYFASDLTTSTQRGTGPGGIIEVMTVSSTGGGPSIGQGKFKWPMASNSAETNVSDTLDHDFVDADDGGGRGGGDGNIPSSNTSMQTSLQIPPPPPPPAAASVGRAAMFGTSSRQSSLGGGAGGFCAFPPLAAAAAAAPGIGSSFMSQPAALYGGSITSIDQSYPIYPSASAHHGFHQGRPVGLSGAMSATLSRLPQTPSTTLASTFGYPYNTLTTHSPYGHGYGQIARAQQQFQPLAPLPLMSRLDQQQQQPLPPPQPSNMGPMQANGNGTIDDTDDTELSLQIGVNDEVAAGAANVDRDLNMMMMILDKSPEDDDLSDQETSLTRKYQLRPAAAAAAAQGMPGSSAAAGALVQQQTLSSFASDSLLLEN